MPILLKRVYEPSDKRDGIRILVERLWPRGLSKQKANVDLWLKDVAPSSGLRRWFNHDPAKWPEFKRRYFKELRSSGETLAELTNLVRTKRVTFVFASKEAQFNNAVALKEFLEKSA